MCIIKLDVWTATGGPKRPTHPPQSLTCGHEFMLNSLQWTTCKFCSVALISDKNIEHNTAPFSLLKKCLYLNYQNVTRTVNFWKYFSKILNREWILHCTIKKIQIFWSLLKFTRIILSFGGVFSRPSPQNFKTNLP